MSKLNYFLLICFVVLLNIVMLYLYDKNIQKKNVEELQTQSITEIYSPKAEINYHVNQSRQTAITNAVSIIEPTVVSVNVLKTINVRRNVNPILEHLFSDYFSVPLRREIQSVGSGVIFTDDGFIITNSHVVDGATEIKIVLHDATEYDAKLIGQDKINDIAVLKVDGKNLPYARLGTSIDLLIGEWSIAVGNPYGFLMKDSKPSVSVGVISALDRNMTDTNEGRVFRGMIQTDAAINPGNSGGPLVNVLGEVVGINSFIISQSGGSIGIGFAIPIDKVKIIVDELVSFGRIRQVHIGLLIQDINALVVRTLRLRNTDGVIVVNVENNSPAYRAGLRRGDIIINVNNINIRNSRDVEIVFTEIKPTQEVSITYIRDGKENRVVMVAGEYI